LVQECRERVGLVLPFEDHEREFLVRENEKGEIAPELLTGDSALVSRIKQHPQLMESNACSATSEKVVSLGS